MSIHYLNIRILSLKIYENTIHFHTAIVTGNSSIDHPFWLVAILFEYSLLPSGSSHSMVLDWSGVEKRIITVSAEHSFLFT